MTETSKASVTFIEITEETAGQRLDNFLLRHLKGVPKSHVYRIVRAGEVRVNKGRADVTRKLEAGDVVRVPPVRVAEKPDNAPALAASGQVELPILFEDDALIAINKPSGVAVHGGSGLSFGVIELLRAQRPQAKFLELVHRLDRDTSGILLVAKKRSALVKLHEMLRDNHQIDKRYLALVQGVWPEPRSHVKFKLLKYETPDGERRVKKSADGLTSHTVVNRRQTFADASLLECELKTGRTHQIRVHLAESGHPILGDDKYGDPAINRLLPRAGLRRLFLHAWRLTLIHPLSGDKLQLEAPLAKELQTYLDTLN
ncbi:23S rRNA pseudouridine955/2504/2580 synthase [Andreprevotia lacus DSM 23236]|jgi:23S rRNA pseudouridine955/2504/2580 synthase|uniref:Pseudouridine synthase n=1 Tax=Andreprevotia lacus DSM 23236 TaxID=1121001 RepID=A0A1W1X6D3_9NEIS|nr:23S rRNA pseudouridine(955/2504/2580) synthase RluC [Andreprevotia lacus]SMC19495.1 23S rRNA pseudouridine955/2504/2580 synthase [Andreprevotia lacus DSM 23236]